MKKLLCLLLIVCIALPVCASAENEVSKYSKLLYGKWNSAGYSGVPNGSNHCCTNLNYFVYPGNNDATVYDKEYSTKTTTVLVGDETGIVYLYISDSFTGHITVGRVMFSENGNILLLLCEDGASFIFVKD